MKARWPNITRHPWSFCRNTDNNEHGFVHFSSMTSNFLDNACTKIQNMAFKTSKMDQIAIEYWYYGFLGRLRFDGRGFLHQKPILKKRSPEQKSRCCTCAEACHSPFNLDCFSSLFYTLIGGFHLNEWFLGPNHYISRSFFKTVILLLMTSLLLKDVWQFSSFMATTAQLRFVTETATKSPFLCVNKSSIRYGFRAGAKTFRYTVVIV